MRKLLVLALSVVLVVSALTVGVFATDYEGEQNTDFTTYYYADYYSITREYYPYTWNTTTHSSYARTVLNLVNSEYQTHYAYVVIYGTDAVSHANWSYNLSGYHVYSGYAYANAYLYAKKVIHYAEKAYDAYSFNTYRWTAN